MTTSFDHDHDHAPAIARLRRTLLLLSHNQSERQQIEAAGRHLRALGAAMLWGEAHSSVGLDHPRHGEGRPQP